MATTDFALISATISSFMDYCSNNSIKIYNEISLQLELGNYLRNKLKDYYVRFERNISYYNGGKEKENFEKREIDIVLFKGNDEKSPQEIYAIELKYPKNKQYPVQMFSFLQDIRFMEQVKTELNFTGTFCLTLVDDCKFYESKSKSKNPIYNYFRVNTGISVIPSGVLIQYPLKNKALTPRNFTISRTHKISWQKPGKNCDWIEVAQEDKNETKDIFRYYLIAIS